MPEPDLLCLTALNGRWKKNAIDQRTATTAKKKVKALLLEFIRPRYHAWRIEAVISAAIDRLFSKIRHLGPWRRASRRILQQWRHKHYYQTTALMNMQKALKAYGGKVIDEYFIGWRQYAEVEGGHNHLGQSLKRDISEQLLHDNVSLFFLAPCIHSFIHH